MKKLFLLLSLFLLPISCFAKTTSDYQVWLPVNMNFKFSEHWRGFLELQPRLAEDATHLKTGIVRPAIGYALDHNWTLWAGYLMQASDHLDDKYDIENRAWQGVSYKTKILDDNFTFEARNRFEERFLPHNSDVSLRWRTRLRGEYVFPNTNISLIGSEEIFVNANDNGNDPSIHAGFDQNRAYVGLGYRFTKWFQLESGYLQQHVWGYAGKNDQNNNVWMSNLNFNF